MKLTNLPSEFTKALPVLRQIEAAGYEAFFVGGSVRDVLLNQPIHDVDIATSAFPAEIKEIFPRTIDVGIEHGTVLVLQEDAQYEITTFRTESTYQDYRRPDHVEFVRSLEEDLKRRDFTINAFALKDDGEIIDLFEGLVDLDAKILRAVGNPHERFHEDALRMMRGLRFISQLGFHLETETFDAIYENHQLLAKISVERINIEFTKLLLGAFRNQAVKLLVETECYQYCPGLRNQGEALLRFADLNKQVLKNETQAWVLLVDQLGLSETEIKPFLKDWKASNELIQDVREVYWGLQRRKDHSWLPMELYRLGERRAVLSEELLNYYDFPHDSQKVVDQVAKLPIHSLKQLAINGNDLMEAFNQKPGKWLKELLSACEQAVVEGELPNEPTLLLAYAEKQLEVQK